MAEKNGDIEKEMKKDAEISEADFGVFQRPNSVVVSEAHPEFDTYLKNAKVLFSISTGWRRSESSTLNRKPIR